jgi:hypothetical protein
LRFFGENSTRLTIFRIAHGRGVAFLVGAVAKLVRIERLSLAARTTRWES